MIYPGRFQPFGPHHKKVFDALSKRFDDAFITTSNIQQMPRHPLNFNEKVKHMVKMGVPKNKIIQERVAQARKFLTSNGFNQSIKNLWNEIKEDSKYDLL